MERQRTDRLLVGSMVKALLEDFEVAMETESLREWADAVKGLAEYMAERHKPMRSDD